MSVKKNLAKGTVAAVLGLSALGLGAGGAIASADPGYPCYQGDCDGHGGDFDRGHGRDDHQWRPDGYADQYWDGRSWDQRSVDDARFDHHPFNWQGQRVEPYWDQGRNAWGFWFFGVWIPL